MDLSLDSAGSAVLSYHDDLHHFQPQTVFPAHPHPPSATVLSTTPPSPDRDSLPKVGQTRCYWALLTTSLQFLVLDPVLRYHLQDQAAQFLHCSLLDFVHADERESAQRDLGSVLEERTLHGSVTRVRYCRLSRVRRLLGWSDSSLPYPPSFPAERIAIDADYMAVYLVVNYVANGLVLCFIHAVVDIAPTADNDEYHKTGWSNWCSTYGFGEEQARELYQRLCETTSPVPNVVDFPSDPSLRIFQILCNQPDRSLVLSWPPDSALFEAGYSVPIAAELARLAQHVQIGYSVGGRDDNDARTSCTRRYKSVQNINLATPKGAKTVQVESIFIPHGMIIFACHKVNGAQLRPVLEYVPARTHRDQIHSHLSELVYSKTLAVSNQACDNSARTRSSHASLQGMARADSQMQPHYGADEWARHKESFYLQDDYKGASQAVDERSCLPTISRDTRAGPSPTATVSDIADSSSLSSTPVSSEAINTSDRESYSTSQDIEGHNDVTKHRPSRGQPNGFGRSLLPPAGVERCLHCQTTHSPEWRKGPNGKKELCNACGLRYSRSRAKDEGNAPRRRKAKEGVPSGNRQTSLHQDSSEPKAAFEAVASPGTECLQSSEFLSAGLLDERGGVDQHIS